MSEQSVDLAQAVSALWRSRWRMLVVACSAGVLGLGLAYLKGNEYTANSVLFIQNIRIGSTRVSQEEEETTPETFIGFLTNDYTLRRVIAELGLDREGQGYKIRDLRGRVDAHVGRNASSIELSVKMDSPTLALRVAESLIGQATRFNEELVRQDVLSAQRLLQVQLAALEKELAGKTEAWRSVRQTSRLESDVERIGQLEVAHREVMDDYNRVEALMEQRRAEYESYSAALRVEPATKTLRQALVRSPVFTEISRKFDDGSGNSIDLLEIELDNEIENYLYTELKTKVTAATAEYQGARVRLDVLRRQIEELRKQIDAVQDRYNATYPRETQMKHEFNAAQIALSDVVHTYAKTASEVFWERQQLRVVPPVRPDSPSGPNRLSFAVAAFLLAGVLASVVVIARIPAGRLIRQSP